MSDKKTYVSVFSGSKRGNSARFSEDAQILGVQLAKARIGIVCGGGESGLMGTLIDSAVDHGGSVTGIILRNRLHDEIPHSKLSKIIQVDSTSERKTMLIAGSRAAIALPGGPGVLDEICSTLALGRLGHLMAPLILINTNNYFDGFMNFYEEMNKTGFRSEQGFHPVISGVEEFLRLIP